MRNDIAIKVEGLSKRYGIGQYVGEGKVEFDFTGMYEQIQSEKEFEIIGFSAEIFEETLQI